MKRPDRMQVIRYIVYTLAVFLLFFIGDTPFLVPRLWDAAPALMLSAAVGIALSGEKEIPAMAFGVLCGLLMDFSRSGPYGFHAVILAVLCYFAALLVRVLFQKNLLSALLMTVVTVAVVFTLQWIFFYLIHGYGSPLYALTRHYGPMALYTLAATVPVYFFFRLLAWIFRSERQSA